ncbi:MAG: hypothetical protein P1V81_18730, partial [Planctomycetota bacterium]|nr:hypothetical protein [Planctomycetota bacterium]
HFPCPDRMLRLGARSLATGANNLVVMSNVRGANAPTILADTILVASAANAWAADEDEYANFQSARLPWIDGDEAADGEARQPHSPFYYLWISEILRQVGGSSLVSSRFFGSNGQVLLHLLSALRFAESGKIHPRSVAELFNAGIAARQVERDHVHDSKRYLMFGVLVNVIGVHWFLQNVQGHFGEDVSIRPADGIDCIVNLGGTFTDLRTQDLPDSSAAGSSMSGHRLAACVLTLLDLGARVATQDGDRNNAEKLKARIRELVETWKLTESDISGLEPLMCTEIVLDYFSAHILGAEFPGRISQAEISAYPDFLRRAYEATFPEGEFQGSLDELRDLIQFERVEIASSPRKLYKWFLDRIRSTLMEKQLPIAEETNAYTGPSLAMALQLVGPNELNGYEPQVEALRERPRIREILSDEALSEAFEGK